MSFDTVSALEIPQLATELTTEELKQICGGWNCNNNNNNNNNCDNNNNNCDDDPRGHDGHRGHRGHRRHHRRDGGHHR